MVVESDLPSFDLENNNNNAVDSNNNDDKLEDIKIEENDDCHLPVEEKDRTLQQEQQQQQQPDIHTLANTGTNDLDISSSSVHSGLSSVSYDVDDNDDSNNDDTTTTRRSNRRRNPRPSRFDRKRLYTWIPTRTSRAIMDAAATHSRKQASRTTSSRSGSSGGGTVGIVGGNSSSGLTVPTGAESSSELPTQQQSHHHNQPPQHLRGSKGSLSAAAAFFTNAPTGTGVSLSSTPTLTLSAWQYWTRLTDLRQMDMQSALDQMKTLLSTRPHIVYKTSYYRKQTKNHWARDDPAFLFLQGLFLIISAVAYSVAFRMSLTGSISFLLYTVVWNWLGLGIVVATVCREIANRQLVGQQTATSHSHVRQQVEWLYAFDIHCNSFFLVFVVLYGAQFFLLPLVLGEGLIPMLLANSLHAVALSWYWYITHLGYRSLPFLGNTEVFLFPIAAIALVFVVSLIGYPFGFGWNAARVMARFYFM